MAEDDANKQISQFDTGAKHASHLYDAESSTQPTEHDGFVGNLLSSVSQADAEKCGLGLCSKAMDHFIVIRCIHPAVCWSQERFGLNALWQWQ